MSIHKTEQLSKKTDKKTESIISDLKVAHPNEAAEISKQAALHMKHPLPETISKTPKKDTPKKRLSPEQEREKNEVLDRVSDTQQGLDFMKHELTNVKKTGKAEEIKRVKKDMVQFKKQAQLANKDAVKYITNSPIINALISLFQQLITKVSEMKNLSASFPIRNNPRKYTKKYRNSRRFPQTNIENLPRDGNAVVNRAIEACKTGSVMDARHCTDWVSKVYGTSVHSMSKAFDKGFTRVPGRGTGLIPNGYASASMIDSLGPGSHVIVDFNKRGRGYRMGKTHSVILLESPTDGIARVASYPGGGRSPRIETYDFLGKGRAKNGKAVRAHRPPTMYT